LTSVLKGAAPVLTDAELARARSLDRAALTALILAHQRSVYSIAVRMLGSREAAEDLTQEVFMQMHEHLQSIQTVDHLFFWLRRVTTNRALNLLRHRNRFPTKSLDEEPEMVDGTAAADPIFARHLLRHLDELSPAARAVLLLRYQEDVDPPQIAEILEMPVNTVKSHLKRSLDSLRQGLLHGATDRREGHPT
jgi:RNA polymerase sigma-70 factor, ECF subfamily